MNTAIAGIHQTVHQPVPVIGRLNHKPFELIFERGQGLQNQIKIVANPLFENTIEIAVQDPNVGI